MRTSAKFAAAVVAVVGAHEGLQLAAYRDPIGIPTICYGETKHVRMGMTATRAECDALLVRSLIEHEDGMLTCLTSTVPEGAHMAFLSLTYNIGVGNFCRSTLVRKANAGDLHGACDEILKWNKAGGIVWRGLVRRREEERKICIGGLP
ncbi:MAG: lysozyme [Pseudorhodoplanes sp.]|nr:lysozyme [Pseudorhodoplanes sp.]